MSEWISVEHRLPPHDERVLVYLPNYDILGIDIDCWVKLHEAPVSFSSQTICIGEGWEENDYEDITHWMPLPEPPK